MENEKRPLAILVQVESSHGTKRVCGYVVWTTPEGKVRNFIGGDMWSQGAEYGDLRVHAYLGADHYGSDPDAAGKIWGHSHGYTPHDVDLPRAEVMVKFLRKIAKGLDRLEQEEGYVEDYCTYLLRIARVLGIKTFFVRKLDGGPWNTGEDYRRTDGAGVQGFLQSVSHETVAAAKDSARR